MTHDSSNHEPSRRAFVKKAVYVAPAILTLAVAPSYVKAASDKPKTPIDPKPKPKPKPPKP
jgi:hypothetical protein